MKIFYSLQTKGFYDTSIEYKTLPQGLIEITREKHRELLDGLYSDKEIVFKDNELVLVDRVPEPPSWNAIRSTRNSLLAKSDYTQMPDWPGDKEAWKKYRQALRDLPQTYADTASIIWPTVPSH